MKEAEDSAYENKRLRDTIGLAKEQLEKARLANQDNKSAIITAKREVRENSEHSIANLWSGEGFEALAELSQQMNAVINKIACYEATENKIVMLENMIKSPYFARIDFKEEGEDCFEEIYIGRSSLINNASIFVYDWRSPIASVFYRFVKGAAFYEAPCGRITGEVCLKRQYEINNGILEYFFDSDLQIIDEFLRKLLSQNTSPKMKSIVETIQKEQYLVIRDMENDLLMVQGAAGSGKTSVALHRAAYLMYQGLASKLLASNIMIISPNSLFENYISRVLPELGEDNICSVIFDEIVGGILGNKKFQKKNNFLEGLLTAQLPKAELLKAGMSFKGGRAFLEILDRFIEDLPLKWIEFENVYHKGRLIASKEALRERILTGHKTIPLGVRLRLLADYVIGLINEGKPARKAEEEAIRKELGKFTELDVKALYISLFERIEYFSGLANESLGCVDEVLSFTRDNLSLGLLTYDDSLALAYFAVKINGFNEFRNIKQVVIDEAQDYYPVHYELCRLVFPNAKYTVLGDINQTLEKGGDLSLYEMIRKTLDKKKSSLIIMDKSFRCTNEILSFSSNFIDKSLEIKSFNREGEMPSVFLAADSLSLANMIVSEVKLCLKKGYRSIGLICKTEKNARSLYGRLNSKIDVSLIKSSEDEPLTGVLIIPVYMSKGLEFDAVLICDGGKENYWREDDKRLLYIGCTRALHRLNIFCQGEAGPLLQGAL